MCIVKLTLKMSVIIIMMLDWIVAIVVIIKGACKVMLSLVKKCNYECLVVMTFHSHSAAIMQFNSDINLMHCKF